MKGKTIERNARLHEEEIRKCLDDNLTLERCSIETGLSIGAFLKYCGVLGLKRKRKKTVRASKRDELILVQRRDGATFQEIAGEFGITRERVRQIIQRKFPEVAIRARIKGYVRCPVCDTLRDSTARPNAPHCSSRCTRLDSPIRNHETWNRDMAVKIMHLRDQGKTWEDVSSLLFPEGVSYGWLRSKMMVKGYLFSSEEWEKYFPDSDQKKRIGYKPK